MKRQVLTLQELSILTESKLQGDPSFCINNVADLESAGIQDASFLGNPLYEKAMLASKAGVIFVSPSQELVKGRNFLISENPSRAFQKTVEAFIGDIKSTGFTGIHETAVIHPSVHLGHNVQIGPRVVIDEGVFIDDNTNISAGCYIGPETKIGRDCFFHPNAVIRERCQIGNRVILQPGALIGSCGFGYTQSNEGKHTKLNQVGIVILEDDVEIGANATLDRSRFKATKIGKGTKIDNLVQIAHGVVIGDHCIIIAQTGIAGSTHIGSHVMIGGQASIGGHLIIADQVMIAAKSGVTKSIPKAGKYGGFPCVPLNEYNRNSVYLRNIETFIDQIKELKSKLLP